MELCRGYSDNGPEPPLYGPDTEACEGKIRRYAGIADSVAPAGPIIMGMPIVRPDPGPLSELCVELKPIVHQAREADARYSYAVCDADRSR